MEDTSSEFVMRNGEPVSLESNGAQPKPRRAWVRLFTTWWGIRISLFIVGAILAGLSASWKFFDHYAPWVNRYLHASVTDQEDINYEVYKLQQAEGRFNHAVQIDENASLAERRQLLLANAVPALDDTKTHFSRLVGAWVQETRERTVPASCSVPMNRLLYSFDAYLKTEHQVMETVRAVDPNSPTSLSAFEKSMEPLSKQEDTAVESLQNSTKSLGDHCKDY